MYSVFLNGSRAGRTYVNEADAQLDADARNAKANALGTPATYEVKEYTLDAQKDGREVARNSFIPLPA